MNLKLTQLTAAIALVAASSFAQAQNRPADIVSPTGDKVLATKVSPADARKAGRAAYEKPTPQNSIMLFIDHQIGLMASVRDFQQASGYKSNVVSLAKMAKAMPCAKSWLIHTTERLAKNPPRAKTDMPPSIQGVHRLPWSAPNPMRGRTICTK